MRMAEKRLSGKERLHIIARAKNRCEYCQSWRKYASQSFELEHIVPLSRGGETSLENLAYACGGCNRHKYNKISAFDPVSGQDTLLFNPRQHSWNNHFGWNDDYSMLIGISPIGRVTIETLRLNRDGVVNMRKLLRSLGLHPTDHL